MATVRLDERRINALKPRKPAYDIRDRELKGYRESKLYLPDGKSGPPANFHGTIWRGSSGAIRADLATLAGGLRRVEQPSTIGNCRG